MATLNRDVQRAVSCGSVVGRSPGGPGLDAQDIVGEWAPEGKKLVMPIPAPTGRQDPDQMVDHPYTRYGITEATQSRIVPTLIRQKR